MMLLKMMFLTSKAANAHCTNYVTVVQLLHHCCGGGGVAPIALQRLLAAKRCTAVTPGDTNYPDVRLIVKVCFLILNATLELYISRCERKLCNLTL